MSHRSLFKEVAQRIVQSAQSCESQAPGLGPSASTLQADGSLPPPQMMAGTFSPGQAAFTSPTDRSPESHH